MSYITLAEQGLQAFESRDWEEAVAKLKEALSHSKNPKWLLVRCKALIHLNRYDESLKDAELAVHTASERNKRELLWEAQYRRAVAHFRLGQYANADCCCIFAMRLIKGGFEKDDFKAELTDANGFWTADAASAMLEAQMDGFNRLTDTNEPRPRGETAAKVLAWRQASTLRIQSLTAIRQLPAQDARRKVTVSALPALNELADVKVDSRDAAAIKAAPTRQALVSVSNEPPRVQDFQTDAVMSISIFSKGTNKDKLVVDFHEKFVRLDNLVWPDGESKELLLQTRGEIDPSQSTFQVTPNKVELRLVKAQRGKWAQTPVITITQPMDAPGVARLEQPEAAQTAAEAEANRDTKQAVPASIVLGGSEKPAENTHDTVDAKPSGPSYPTSARGGPKNWDKIAADENQEDESDVHSFFKQLYKDATDEQKRAMMKSFTESNGTTLSTDWDDVGSRKVETKPPEGVEAKEW